MERFVVEPRDGYREILWEQGFVHLGASSPENNELCEYWNEGVVYSFTPEEVENLAVAAEQLHDMVLEAVEYLLTGEMGLLGYSPTQFEQLRYNYLQQPPTLCGRFDLAYNPDSYGIKMYGYRTDHVAGMYETGIVQGLWREDVFPQDKQFNQLTESLENRWLAYKGILPDTVHFLHPSSLWDKNYEHWVNNAYMRELAKSAGYATKDITITDLQWAPNGSRYLQDSSGEHVRACFKLSPWHKTGGTESELFNYSAAENTLWVEPLWRNLSQNRATLVALSHLFPNNELILPAHIHKPDHEKGSSPKKWIKKSLFTHQNVNQQPPLYMYQQSCTPKEMTNRGVYATPSVWMVGDNAVALSVKEFDAYPEGQKQHFTPHIVT